MRILFLTQVLPFPLDAGPKVRAYYVLRQLAEHGHAISLLSFVRSTDSQQSIDHLKRYCLSVHLEPIKRSRSRDAYSLLRSFVLGEPFLIARDWLPEMADRVRKVIREEGPFDYVHSDQLWMAPYALLAHSVQRSQKPVKVLDQHNAVFKIPQRLAENEGNLLKRILLAREAQRMARYEVSTCGKFDRVVWVTSQDLNSLKTLPLVTSTRDKDLVIPICLDPEERVQIPRHPDAHRVTFVGGLHWPPNAAGIEWFAREIWPRIQATNSRAVLTVIGRNPPALNLRSGDRVEATGYLPDPAEFLAETSVFVIPLRAGGGMRVKILDAWAWGIPIVSTPLGAEGMAAEHGRNILLADEAEAFSEAVIQLLTDPVLAKRLVTEGRRTLQTHYHWRQVYPAWKKIYGQELTANPEMKAAVRSA